MNKEILIWVLGIEDCQRSKELHGHKGRYVCGQAPREEVALEGRMDGRLECGSTGGTGWTGLPVSWSADPHCMCVMSVRSVPRQDVQVSPRNARF